MKKAISVSTNTKVDWTRATCGMPVRHSRNLTVSYRAAAGGRQCCDVTTVILAGDQGCDVTAVQRLLV